MKLKLAAMVLAWVMVTGPVIPPMGAFYQWRWDWNTAVLSALRH